MKVVKEKFISCDILIKEKFENTQDALTENKQPIIQELPSDEAKPDTSFDPEELEKELVEVAKDFDADLTVEPKKAFNKDEYMFVMALLKSGIESSKIGVTKEEIDLKIKDYKFLFQMNFHN